MFFLLSKTIYFVLMPTTVIIALTIFSLLSRRAIRGRRALLSAVLLLLFFTNPLLANLTMAAWEHAEFPNLAKPEHEQLAIVLTGVMKTRADANDLALFDRGVSRPLKAVELYQRGLVTKILISGGDAQLIGEEIPESERMRDFLINLGVAATDIIVENRSRNTFENAKYTAEILQQNAYQHLLKARPILITSAFHLPRSLACFAKQGLDVQPYSVDFWSHQLSPSPQMWLFPTPQALVMWERMIKEWLGFIAYYLAGYV